MRDDIRFRGIGMTSQRTRERLVQRLREKGIADERVLEVMRQLPRHLFVDEALASHAYEDKSLPIGHGQTLSQPHTVARMTEILLQQAPCRVLEVGTGSGYQTAVLAGLVEEVFSIERLSVLSERARIRLRELGCRNVRLRTGDGSSGWADHAPFDGILVTAAPEEVPEQLLYQLVDGGRLVIPVGGASGQRLLAITRQGDRFIQDSFDAVTFVPLLAGSESR